MAERGLGSSLFFLSFTKKLFFAENVSAIEKASSFERDLSS